MKRIHMTISQLSKGYPFLLLAIFILSCKQKSATESHILPDPLEAGWNGNSVCVVIHENDHLRILKCTFPPGVGHEKHYHAPHVGYTLAGGKFKMIDSRGTREVDVPEGYVFSNDSISTHEVLNIGETTAQFLIIEYK